MKLNIPDDIKKALSPGQEKRDETALPAGPLALVARGPAKIDLIRDDGLVVSVIAGDIFVDPETSGETISRGEFRGQKAYGTLRFDDLLNSVVRRIDLVEKLSSIGSGLSANSIFHGQVFIQPLTADDWRLVPGEQTTGKPRTGSAEDLIKFVIRESYGKK